MDAANPYRKRINHHHLGSEDVVLWRKHKVLRLVNKIANLIDLLLTVSVKHFDGINSKIWPENRNEVVRGPLLRFNGSKYLVLGPRTVMKQSPVTFMFTTFCLSSFWQKNEELRVVSGLKRSLFFQKLLRSLATSSYVSAAFSSAVPQNSKWGLALHGCPTSYLQIPLSQPRFSSDRLQSWILLVLN